MWIEKCITDIKIPHIMVLSFASDQLQNLTLSLQM